MTIRFEILTRWIRSVLGYPSGTSMSADIANVMTETETIEHHLHNISKRLPYSADGANIAGRITLTAGSPGYGAPWVQIETAANLQTAFPGKTQADAGKILMFNALAAKEWEVQLGYGPDAGSVTPICDDGFISGAAAGSRDASPQVPCRLFPVDGTQNLYGRLRANTDAGTLEIAVYAHAYA